jgi:MFS family permease
MTPKALWTLAITSVAVFMVTLDNLVVTTAIPVIRKDLRAGLSGLQWTVNAYTLTFAVLLLTGRRWAIASAVGGCWRAESRSSPQRPPVRRWRRRSLRWTLLGRCRGWRRDRDAADADGSVWRGAGSSARSGAWHLGRHQWARRRPGAMSWRRDRQRHSWHWVFWLNVPIGLALLPFILLRLEDTSGPASKLDPLGLVLGSAGLVGIVWGLVRANDKGWTSAPIVSAFVLGGALLGCFVAWGRRSRTGPDTCFGRTSVPAREDSQSLALAGLAF